MDASCRTRGCRRIVRSISSRVSQAERDDADDLGAHERRERRRCDASLRWIGSIFLDEVRSSVEIVTLRSVEDVAPSSIVATSRFLFNCFVSAVGYWVFFFFISPFISFSPSCCECEILRFCLPAELASLRFFSITTLEDVLEERVEGRWDEKEERNLRK